ncbi:structural PPIase-like protein [Acanthamoeba polyphaga mimivirus]|uniref:Structural PPIase-like protein n=1 Tax=Acanthamoeba polyphaga mimivirus Kroon TaxID=3069720 RepID=A0A0G2Y6X2_9VIRU|nr:structural PPIase-like protein [Acanthamoeba polyphaga mimivirus]AKI80339.1 structural PPIase-like protein [Acanthamoeba polyphaga mimivirus Kroon]
MNYSLEDLPNSGKNPRVYMDIVLNNEIIGRLQIKLFRDAFPAGVENFVQLANGKTYRVNSNGTGKYKYNRHINRTYEGCKFHNILHNNYIVSGDIYNSNGSSAGTVYCDEPIPPVFGDYFYPHESKGLVSLVPYTDESGNRYYDSTFMITLDDIRPSNVLDELDRDQVVIGQVYGGLDVLDKINSMIKPYAGRKYPTFSIGKCGAYLDSSQTQRKRPINVNGTKRFLNKPTRDN